MGAAAVNRWMDGLIACLPKAAEALTSVVGAPRLDMSLSVREWSIDLSLDPTTRPIEIVVVGYWKLLGYAHPTTPHNP